MSFFIVRTRNPLSTADLTSIEQIEIIDRDPSTPVTGEGYGTMLLVGEFEDGPFNTPIEVYGASSELSTFGGFGYTYGDLLHRNICARRRLGQALNGNGFIKGKHLQPPRKIICRVDTSVGDVTLTLAAALRSNAAPFDMEPADQASVTTDAGGPANSTAVTATDATAAGGGGVFPTLFTGGERIGIQVDALPEVVVTFQAADQLVADVISRINNTMGYTCAVLNGAQCDLSSIQRGSGASITLRDIDAGTLATIGHVAATTPGGGNVANVDAVTAAEAAALLNAGAIGAIFGVAAVDPLTNQVVMYRTGSATGTIQIDDVAGAMATDMGFTTATAVTANVGDAFDVPAGTRVRNAGGDEWVTMRTVSWPEGTVAAPNTASATVEVRDAVDNGTGTGEVAGNVTTIVDFPSIRYVEVNNLANLAVALTPGQIDAAYVTAIDATRNPNTAAREVTVSICAYRSPIVCNAMRQNAIDASDEGCFGRIYVMDALQGTTLAQAIADVANYRRDRVVYSWPNTSIFVSEIAVVGTAGGDGFTADGIINIGASGPLAYIMSRLNPEENDGQDTGLIGFLLGIETTTDELNKAAYVALKAAGICSLRNVNGTLVYQSDVTTELTPGRTTIVRRKMADHIQDSLASAAQPYAKKLATDSQRAGAYAAFDSYLGGLLSQTNPQNSRIRAYSLEDTSEDSPDLFALGVMNFAVSVQLYPSIDNIVFDTQIGTSVNIDEA